MLPNFVTPIFKWKENQYTFNNKSQQRVSNNSICRNTMTCTISHFV